MVAWDWKTMACMKILKMLLPTWRWFAIHVCRSAQPSKSRNTNTRVPARVFSFNQVMTLNTHVMKSYFEVEISTREADCQRPSNLKLLSTCDLWLESLLSMSKSGWLQINIMFVLCLFKSHRHTGIRGERCMVWWNGLNDLSTLQYLLRTSREV